MLLEGIGVAAPQSISEGGSWLTGETMGGLTAPAMAAWAAKNSIPEDFIIFKLERRTR